MAGAAPGQPRERLSEIAYRNGDLRASREHIEEALHLVRGICKVCTENLLSELAQVISARGDDPAAVSRLLAEEAGTAAHGHWR